jgi:hypothetical protein
MGYWGTGPNNEPEWRDQDPGADVSAEEAANNNPNDRPDNATIYNQAPPSGGGSSPYEGAGNTGSGAASNPQQPLFQTVNGPKTTAQMYAELMAVGWGGGEDVVTAYARTTGGTVQYSGSTTQGQMTSGTNYTQAGGTGGGARPQQGQQTPYEQWFQEYLNAENERKAEEAREEKRRWELQHGLSKSADERAAAQLHIQEADQKLRELQYESSKQQFSQSLYSNLAQSLLQGASQLRGPRNWLSYQQFVGGGRNLTDQLFGDARPAFSAPGGGGEPIGIGDVLGQLGFTNGGTGAMSGQQSTFKAPAPHQIPTANWDALSPSAREMLVGAAEAGQTESGGAYAAEDYLSQIEAARPAGTAPTGTRNRYRAPAPVF